MAKEKRFIKSYSRGGNEIWIDSKTGVNYFYHNSGYSDGLTPLLDASGKPIVTPIEEK